MGSAIMEKQEGWVVSHLRGLLKNTFIYGVGDVLGKFIGFILIPIYTKYLTPSEYGTFNLCLLFSGFISIFCLLGINSAFFRFFIGSEDKEKQRHLFSTTFWSISLLSLLVVIVCLIFSKSLSLLVLKSSYDSNLIKIASFNVLIEAILTIFLLIFRAEGRSFVYVSTMLTKLGSGLIFNCFFVIYLRSGPVGIFWSNILSSIVALIIVLPKTKFYLRCYFSTRLLKNLLKYGLPLIPTSIAMIIISLSDRYFIQIFCGIKEVGIYSLGYKFGMAIGLLVTAFNFAWSPTIFWIAREENARKIFSDILTYYTSGVTFFFLGLALFLNELFRLFVNLSFQEASGIVLFIGLSYIFYGFYLNFQVGLYLKDKTGWVALLCITAAILNITLNFLLIPKYGIEGAAVATLFSYIVLALMGFWFSQGCYKISYQFGKVLKIALIAGGIFYFSSRFLGPKLSFDLLAFKILMLTAYTLSLFIFRIIPAPILRKA